MSGGYKKNQYFTALDAAGSLTIQAGTKGTGTLSVFAGKVHNSGNARTYSSGIAVNSDFTVKGGQVTARGGHIEGYDSCFSIGVNMDNNIKNKALLITGATLTFQDGDKPVFTGKIPDGVPYKLIYEAWQTDGEGLSSQEWFNNEDHLATWGGKLISTFDKNKTYTYKLYLTTAAAGSDAGYYFGANTKLKINGTLYSYRLVNVDPDYDSSGRIYTFWAYTDLTMAPQTSDTSPDYKVTEGANGTWTQNSGGTLRFASNGDLSKFTGDNSSIVLWISLLFVGGVLAGVPVVLRKKREHR